MPDQTPAPDPTQQNPPTSPPDPAAPQPSPLRGGAASTPAPAVKPHRRRHLIIKSILLLIAGVLILIAFLPTLLSMGWARHIAEDKANAQLNGKLAIGNWSLGWFTGASIASIDLTDSAGKPVLQLASVDTHLSLTDVIRGNLNLGKVPVTGLRLYVIREPDGTLNVQKLLPPSPHAPPSPPPEHPIPPSPPSPPSPPPTPPPPSAPSKLPNISIDLELSDCQVTFTDAVSGQSVTFPISGSINIPDINQPITNAIQVAIQPAGGATAGTISLSGSIAAVHNNQVDSDQPDVDETLKISGADLSALQPMLAGAFTTFAGQGDGEFSIRLQPHAAGSVKGGLSVTQIKAAGPATKGDTFAADSLILTVPQATLPTAGGLDAIATTADRLNAGATITLQQGASKSTVYLTADTALSALSQLSKNQSPGQPGKVEIGADIDLAHIANQLPHLFVLKPGMSLDTAELKAAAGVVMTANDATPSVSLAIDQISGKNAGKPIALKPITLTASVTDIGGGGTIPKLQDLKADLSSAFATGSLAAPTPSQLSGQFSCQLADAQRELGQIIDFGSATMTGTIAGNISSQGSLTDDPDPSGDRSAKIDGTLTASALHVERPGSPPIDVPSVNYTLAANLVRGASLTVEKITGFDITGAVGPADHPALSTHFSTDLTFGKNSSVVASNVNASGSVLVPELRRELGTAASDQMPSDYTLKMLLSATVAASPSAMSLEIPTFSVTDNHGLISVQRVGDKTIRFATGTSRQHVSPSGTLSVSADLAQVAAMLSTPSKGSATLIAGHLDGSLVLSGDQEQTQFQEDYKATGMQVRADKRTTSLSPVELKSTAAFGPGDQVTVSEFSASAAGGEVHLKQPLVIATSDLGRFAINTELVGSGDVAQAMAFVNAFQPAPPRTTYTGSYTLDQNVATTAEVITAMGSVHGNFAISNPGGASFAEQNLALLDDLSYDQPHDSATLTNLSLDMHDTGALRIAARGTVRELTGTRTMQGVSADLHYDAAGLWKLIYATLSTEQQGSYKDVKLAGVVDRHFLVAGSYPANQPFNVAVQSLTVQGGIALPSFSGKGMTIANLDLPLSLHGGKFLIAQPAPASMNDGTLSLNGTTVDLGDPHMRLSIPDNTAVLNNVSLNKVFVQNAAGWVNNPLFVGTDQAAGILNLVIDHCDRLPTDDLVKATTADNDGHFHMHMMLGRVQIGAPMLADVSKAVGPLLGGKFKVPSLQGEIPNYTLDLAKGIATTDMTMNLSQNKHPLHLWGTVALASQKLNMTLELPTALFGGANGPVAQAAGEFLTIPITGTTSHPKFNLKSLVQKNILNNPGKDLKNLIKGF